MFSKTTLICQTSWLILVVSLHCLAITHHHFKVNEAPYKRLCCTKKILTVNGKFPGPTLRVHKGEMIHVTVHNQGKYNISIHWHGVKMPRYPWSDGPEYITQCPIQPGSSFRQKVIFSEEEGTLWWHAHSDWSRATVHGAIIIYPKRGTPYPFPKPHAEVPIIFGEWWKRDVMQVLQEALITGGDPNVSDAFTINGQPGDLYPCSKSETFKLNVTQGMTYLLHIVNAAMNNILFFSVAKHNLTIVGEDGSYTKPLTTKYITISPGQSLDALLHANRSPNHSYCMAARSYSSGTGVSFDNTTTTATLRYNTRDCTSTLSSKPILPHLPYYNNTKAAFKFYGKLRSLADKQHSIEVPKKITIRIVSTLSINTCPCPKNHTCEGPNGTRLAASMNNISFESPRIDVLKAYYHHFRGVYGDHFPSFPPLKFNFTATYLPLIWEIPKRATQVKILRYNSTVEVVFQGTNLVAGLDHPMHLHGYSFYVVGFGFGSFDKDKDPKRYNLVDPPTRNTVTVPKNGWIPSGVWYLNCHFERHLS